MTREELKKFQVKYIFALEQEIKLLTRELHRTQDAAVSLNNGVSLLDIPLAASGEGNGLMKARAKYELALDLAVDKECF